jgi:hypothetical protein
VITDAAKWCKHMTSSSVPTRYRHKTKSDGSALLLEMTLRSGQSSHSFSIRKRESQINEQRIHRSDWPILFAVLCGRHYLQTIVEIKIQLYLVTKSEIATRNDRENGAPQVELSVQLVRFL